MKKVDFLKPLWWFCLLPIYFILVNILYIVLTSFFSSISPIKYYDHAPTATLIGAILSFAIFLIYLKSSGESFSIKSERINIQCILKCLCIVFTLQGTFIFFKYYTIADVISFFKIHDYMFYRSGFRIFTRPILSDYTAPFIALFMAPIGEELLFRRTIYDSMKQQSRSVLIAMIYSSILFSLAHFYGANYDIYAFIGIFGMGLMYAYCYEQTGSVLSSIILHSLSNAYLIFAECFIVPYRFFYFMFLWLIGVIVIIIAIIMFLRRKKLDIEHKADEVVSLDVGIESAEKAVVESSDLDE